MPPQLLFVFLEFQLLQSWGLILWRLCIESLRLLAQTFEFTYRFYVGRSRVILPAALLNTRQEERTHFVTCLHVSLLAWLLHLILQTVLGFDDAWDGDYLNRLTVLIIAP